MTKCLTSFVIKEVHITNNERVLHTEQIKSKKLPITKASKDIKRNFHSLLLGIQNGTATLENNLAVS